MSVCASVASVRARFLSFLCCHCLVIASQCLAVCLSCRAFHCCRLMLSDAVGIAVSPLAAAGRVSCVGRDAPFVSMCTLRCDRVPRLGDSRPAWGVVSVVRVSLCRDVVSPSYFVCSDRLWATRRCAAPTAGLQLRAPRIANYSRRNQFTHS